MTANGQFGHAVPAKQTKRPGATKVRSAASEPAPWTMPKGLEGRAVCAVDLIAAAQTAPDFAIDKLAEPGDVVLMKGAEKVTFKTWLAVHLAISVILGTEWLGFAVKKGKPRRVLFVSTETRGTVLVRRLVAACGPSVDAAVIAKYVVIVDTPVTFVPAEEREQATNKAHNDALVRASKVFNHEVRASMMRQAEEYGDAARETLGQNVDVLEAMSVPDTWSLIVVDTLRQCLAGDENSSDDARRFIAAARELARACGCPVLIIHHTGKAGDASEARSSRGSTEITAGPDVVISLDPSGEHPTANFLCRNHESPGPVGYKLAPEEEHVRLDVLPPCAGAAKGMTEDEVLAVFREHASDGLTMTTLRKLVAKARGQKDGSKANPRALQKTLDVLAARGAISACEIGDGRKTMPGWRLGSAGGRAPLAKLDSRNAGVLDLDGDPTDV